MLCHPCRQLSLAHPVFSAASVAAQQKVPGIQGTGGVYFAGAWCGCVPAAAFTPPGSPPTAGAGSTGPPGPSRGRQRPALPTAGPAVTGPSPPESRSWESTKSTDALKLLDALSSRNDPRLPPPGPAPHAPTCSYGFHEDGIRSAVVAVEAMGERSLQRGLVARVASLRSCRAAWCPSAWRESLDSQPLLDPRPGPCSALLRPFITLPWGHCPCPAGNAPRLCLPPCPQAASCPGCRAPCPPRLAGWPAPPWACSVSGHSSALLAPSILAQFSRGRALSEPSPHFSALHPWPLGA